MQNFKELVIKTYILRSHYEWMDRREMRCVSKNLKVVANTATTGQKALPYYA